MLDQPLPQAGALLALGRCDEAGEHAASLVREHPVTAGDRLMRRRKELVKIAGVCVKNASRSAVRPWSCRWLVGC